MLAPADDDDKLTLVDSVSGLLAVASIVPLDDVGAEVTKVVVVVAAAVAKVVAAVVLAPAADDTDTDATGALEELVELFKCGLRITSAAGPGGGEPTTVLLTMLANGLIGVDPIDCFFCLGALGLNKTGSSVDWIILAIGVLFVFDNGQQTAGMMRLRKQTDCFSLALSKTNQIHLRISLHSPS